MILIIDMFIQNFAQAALTHAVEFSIEFAKRKVTRHRVAHMVPEQREKWRAQEVAKIRKRALVKAKYAGDKAVREQGGDRANLARVYEIALLNDLGVRMSQNILEKVDIRGLDLRKERGLSQKQIDLAIGDHTTRLPDYLRRPAHWAEESEK